MDSAGNGYVSGWTASGNFPTFAPLQSANAGSGDAFISRLNAMGSALTFSTYLGGSTGSEFGHGIAVDAAGNFYVAGATNSSNFPATAGAFQTSLAGTTDAFVVKLAALALDIDGDGSTDALTDGLLVLRYLFGFRGTTLINSAIGAGATRTTSAAIETYLASVLGLLDVDGNGTTDALTDGLLVLRYLFGFRGTTLTNSAIGPGANRTTPASIEAYIASL